ncbi:OsmC family protein [Streptococcus caprae]|uniref:OsmC family protein n=1 Tax=Streptococcus caprae TaxID=1640501 RepID=A0ABV8CYF6_9STRE
MYQTKITGDSLYHTTSQGYGDSVELFGAVDNGETPMSLVNIALASCVTMCVQGYFWKKQQVNKVAIETDCHYEDGQFDLTIAIDYTLTEQMRKDILAYANDYCRVKQLFKEEIVVNMTIV